MGARLHSIRIGAWPSGKASVFGIVYRRFESYRPSHPILRPYTVSWKKWLAGYQGTEASEYPVGVVRMTGSLQIRRIF